MKWGSVAAILAALVCGCASADIPRMGAKNYTLFDDERRLQKRADEICQRIDESRFLFQDSQLEQYLTAIAKRLLASQGFNGTVEISVKVVRDPTVNAVSLCNGRIYVCTGLLAMVDNEAQMATILAHEINHILNRDSLREFRSNINKTGFYSSLTAGFGVSPGELLAVSSIAGYSREMENQADTDGFSMMQAAGYDTHESSRVFERMNEFEGLEEAETDERFASHPKTDLRIENLKRLTQENQVPANAEINEREYKIKSFKGACDDVANCFEAAKYKTAAKVISKLLKDNPKSGQLYFYLGELCRRRQDTDGEKGARDKAKDYVKAIDAYNQAISLDPFYAEAFERKGMVLQKQGNLPEAKSAFRRYLEINPKAEDRSYIEKLLNSN